MLKDWEKDIIKGTYHDAVGNEHEVYLLKGNRPESEYQSQLYIRKFKDALKSDGTINIDVLEENVSEIFRKYMLGKKFLKKLLEDVL